MLVRMGMRIPISKVWRAFPEFDAFTDAECAIYVRQAKKRKRATLSSAVLGGLFVGMPLGTAVAVGGVALVNFITDRVNKSTVDPPWVFWVEIAAAVILAFAWGLIGLMSPLIARDITLRRIMRRQLTSLACGCGYSLLGQTPFRDDEFGEAVRCPECGVRVPVGGEHGLRRESLMVTVRDGEASTSEPGNASGSLTPKPIAEAVYGAHNDDPLAKHCPALRDLPSDAQRAAIERVRATQPTRQRLAVGVGIAVGGLAAGVLLAILLLRLIPGFGAIEGWISPSFWTRFSLILAALLAWFVGAWTKRLVRASMTHRAASDAVTAAIAEHAR